MPNIEVLMDEDDIKAACYHWVHSGMPSKGIGDAMLEFNVDRFSPEDTGVTATVSTNSEQMSYTTDKIDVDAIKEAESDAVMFDALNNLRMRLVDVPVAERSDAVCFFVKDCLQDW